MRLIKHIAQFVPAKVRETQRVYPSINPSAKKSIEAVPAKTHSSPKSYQRCQICHL